MKKYIVPKPGDVLIYMNIWRWKIIRTKTSVFGETYHLASFAGLTEYGKSTQNKLYTPLEVDILSIGYNFNSFGSWEFDEDDFTLWVREVRDASFQARNVPAMED